MGRTLWSHDRQLGLDRSDGCPARAGQANTVFEVFRDGHVPECQATQTEPDLFNDTSGVDDVIEIENDDEEEDEEPLF